MVSATGRSRAGRSHAVVLFALLAGLFSMHGLADHGTTHCDQDHAGMAGMSAAAGPATTISAGERSGGSAHPEGALCLALLIAGVALLLARFRHTRAGTYAPRRHVVARVWSPIRARAPDPPDLTGLGLCRC